MKQIKQIGIVMEVRTILFTDTMPEDARPEFILGTHLVDCKGNLTVYDIPKLEKNNPGAIVKNRTVYAGRESWQGATIGQAITDNTDPPLTLRSANLLLKKLSNAEPVSEEIKRIGQRC